MTIEGTVDIEALASVWRQFWYDAPRSLPITGAEFERRVVAAPTFDSTSMLTMRSAGQAVGFVHFGPREDWWFRFEDRKETDASVGVIYALCATEPTGFDELLVPAERELIASGSTLLRLWPTSAQGAVPFYNGLTPSYEVSGLCDRHPSVNWAMARGYRVAARYRLGLWALSSVEMTLPSPQSHKVDWIDFPSPLIPDAKRLVLRDPHNEEVGWVIAAPSPERSRINGVAEWAAFDVGVHEAWRGRGWGRILMLRLVEQIRIEGGERLQIHVVQGNAPAEALYFRSLGFGEVPGGDFVTLEKSLT